MNSLSILLIDNQISTAAQIVQAVSPYLPEYRLSISRSVVEAIAEREPAQVILLSSTLLAENIDRLPSLVKSYPEATVLLLQETVDEEVLLTALVSGVADYVPLTQAGLQVLGRRLAASATSLKPYIKTPLDDTLEAMFDSSQSPLAMQLIGPDNRVLAWNKAMETFSGLEQAVVIGSVIDDLPLSARNLGRLKDILDQARITGEPFTISDFPLENPQGQTRWGRVYVYPKTRVGLDDTTAKQAVDVCIISLEVTDLKQHTLENWHYAQKLQVLLEISREVTQQLDLKATLEKIAEQTKSLLNAANCHIFFLEKDNQTLRPVLSIGPDTQQTQDTYLSIGTGLFGTVAAYRKAVMINAVDSGHQTGDLIARQHLMCAPLTALKGIIGIIIVSKNRQQPPFNQDDLAFFDNLILQASLAINNARLFEETQRNLNELAIFYEASAAISTTWNTQEVLNTLIRQMVQGMEVSHGQIISWDKNLEQGSVQALFVSEEVSAQFDGTNLPRTFRLADRPAVSTIINQQRPVFFQLSNAWLDDSERKDMEQSGCFSRLLVPLVVKSETIGWAELWETRQERIFTPDEVRLVRMLANQTAVTLENARYIRQTRQTLEETTALYEVARALATTQDTQTIMSSVLQEYLRVLDLQQGSVVIFDFETRTGIVQVFIHNEDSDIFTDTQAGSEEVSHSSLEGQQIPLTNNPLYAELMRTRQPVVIEDAHADWLTPPGSASPAAPPLIGGGWAGTDTRSMVVIPIQVRGEITAAIVAEATQQPRAFEGWAISLGQAMADQLSIALQNVQLYELEYERRQQAETLREVSFAVGSSLHLNEVLERILDQLGRVIKYDSAAIHLIEGKRRRIIAGRGFPQPDKVIGLTFPITLDINEPGSVAIHTRQPLVIGNIQELYAVFKETPHSHINSWMGIPLIARDKVIGLISIDRKEVDAYNEGDVNLALAFANQVAIALENARLYELEVRQLERELEIARGIQETLLPQIIPRVTGLEICGRIIPARQIGGDFFHFFSLGQDQFGIAVGDVSGKGIPAALYMAVAMTAIDAQISDTLGPGELLSRLQCVLFNRLHENKMNVGLQVATFTTPAPPTKGQPAEETTGRLMTLASAGMIAPIIATVQGCRYLPVSGLPIGTAMTELVYDESEISLKPFTAIIFTSDGIVEARNEAGELFGFERLEATINQIIDTQDAETIADYVIRTAEEFTGDAEQNDDMTVVVVIAKT
jgi:PAS domain S-box-containing protein